MASPAGGPREADAETLGEAPEELLRPLFEPFQLTVTYDGRTVLAPDGLVRGGCAYVCGALGRIRTYATGSGGRCSIP